MQAYTFLDVGPALPRWACFRFIIRKFDRYIQIKTFNNCTTSCVLYISTKTEVKLLRRNTRARARTHTHTHKHKHTHTHTHARTHAHTEVIISVIEFSESLVRGEQDTPQTPPPTTTAAKNNNENKNPNGAAFSLHVKHRSIHTHTFCWLRSLLPSVDLRISKLQSPTKLSVHFAADGCDPWLEQSWSFLYFHQTG